MPRNKNSKRKNRRQLSTQQSANVTPIPSNAARRNAAGIDTAGADASAAAANVEPAELIHGTVTARLPDKERARAETTAAVLTVAIVTKPLICELRGLMDHEYSFTAIPDYIQGKFTNLPLDIRNLCRDPKLRLSRLPGEIIAYILSLTQQTVTTINRDLTSKRRQCRYTTIGWMKIGIEALFDNMEDRVDRRYWLDGKCAVTHTYSTGTLNSTIGVMEFYDIYHVIPAEYGSSGDNCFSYWHTICSATGVQLEQVQTRYYRHKAIISEVKFKEKGTNISTTYCGKLEGYYSVTNLYNCRITAQFSGGLTSEFDVRKDDYRVKAIFPRPVDGSVTELLNITSVRNLSVHRQTWLDNVCVEDAKYIEGIIVTGYNDLHETKMAIEPCISLSAERLLHIHAAEKQLPDGAFRAFDGDLPEKAIIIRSSTGKVLQLVVDVGLKGPGKGYVLIRFRCDGSIKTHISLSKITNCTIEFDAAGNRKSICSKWFNSYMPFYMKVMQLWGEDD